MLENDTRRFVAYLRVSTKEQGVSGLGLEAQREAVERYCSQFNTTAHPTFVEVESGKNSKRPQLAAALAECRSTGATLVVAKLDRLSRNLAFIAQMMEAGVDFVACDNPHATRFTLHILAAVAEHEREMISVRTKAALQAAKARGVKLGGARPGAGSAEYLGMALEARQRAAAAKAEDVRPYIVAAQKAGCYTLSQIGAALEARGVLTPRGKTKWAPAQVARFMKHA